MPDHHRGDRDQREVDRQLPQRDVVDEIRHCPRPARRPRVCAQPSIARSLRRAEAKNLLGRPRPAVLYSPRRQVAPAGGSDAARPARRLAVARASPRRAAPATSALHRRIGRGRRRLLRRRQRHLRHGEPRPPRRAALQPRGDARLALQPRGAARPASSTSRWCSPTGRTPPIDGTGTFAATGPMTDLRSVMSLYPEALTILARAGRRHRAPRRPLGKRVDIGPPASGRRATVHAADRRRSSLGRDRLRRPARAADRQPRSTSSAPAGSTRPILIVGHPNAAVARAHRATAARSSSRSGARSVDAVLRRSIRLRAGRDPRRRLPRARPPTSRPTRSSPPWSPAPTSPPTSSRRWSPTTLAGLPELAMRAPVLAGLDPTAMRARGLTAPLHPGAARRLRRIRRPEVPPKRTPQVLARAWQAAARWR